MRKRLLFILFAFPALLHAQTMIHGTNDLVVSASDVTPATDDLECGVASVRMFLDGVALGAPIVSPLPDGNYHLVWNSISATNGPHTFTAKATDKAGPNCDGTTPNIGISAPLMVTVQNVDTTPPVVTIRIDLNVSGTVTISKPAAK